MCTLRTQSRSNYHGDVNIDHFKIFSWPNVSVLFVCSKSHEQFFSYLATVTITSDRSASLDLCLTLTAFSSESSFTTHTYCDTVPPFLKVMSKDP
jgi:hypothetical protein